MIRSFKAGQIVPRWLIKASDRKAQHYIKFGCDVEVYSDHKVVATGPGSVFMIRDIYRTMKNGSRKRAHAILSYIRVVGYSQTRSTYIQYKIEK